jgi:hypothetical protein
MAKNSKASAPTSPTKASKQTKIPSPARKKNGFVNRKKMKVKRNNDKPNHCEIKVLATLGDEEMYFLLKPGNDGKLDAYCKHLKDDLDRCRPIQEAMDMVAGFPRRESRENQQVALSHGKSIRENSYICRTHC